MHQRQLWVQCLDQTYFSMQTGEAGASTDFLATAATKLGLELGLGLAVENGASETCEATEDGAGHLRPAQIYRH